MGRLSNEKRDRILKHHADGLSPEDIAEVFEMSVESIVKIVGKVESMEKLGPSGFNEVEFWKSKYLKLVVVAAEAGILEH
jgi:hypothetical protein